MQCHKIDTKAAKSISTRLSGKVGERLSETATNDGDPSQSDDAYLAGVNACFHLVHNWHVLPEARHLPPIGLSDDLTPNNEGPLSTQSPSLVRKR